MIFLPFKTKTQQAILNNVSNYVNCYNWHECRINDIINLLTPNKKITMSLRTEFTHHVRFCRFSCTFSLLHCSFSRSFKQCFTRKKCNYPLDNPKKRKYLQKLTWRKATSNCQKRWYQSLPPFLKTAPERYFYILTNKIAKINKQKKQECKSRNIEISLRTEKSHVDNIFWICSMTNRSLYCHFTRIFPHFSNSI